MNTNLARQLILQLVLILMNAIFACAEIAVISMNSNKLERLAENGDKRAIKLGKLTAEPARFLATIQVAITLSGFLGSAFAADGFSGILVAAIQKTGLPIPESMLNALSVIIITVILSFITLVFGELVPKRIAMRKSESIALGISGIVSFISKLFAPIVWLLTASTNGVLRLIGIDPNADDDEVSEEEIRMMASAGSEKGVIDEEENEIIQNVFDFDDINVDSVATHRTEMIVLWDEDDTDTWRDTINKYPHSFYPVCHETPDNVIGILSARKYFRLPDFSREFIMNNAVDKAYIVPETLGADELLRNMKASKVQFAVVTDEFGGTNGIVTITDLLEELVGDFDGEENIRYKKLNDTTYIFDCSSELDEFEELMGLDLDSDSATLGGWVTEELGKIPEKGDSFKYEDLSIRILDTDGKKPLKIRLDLL